LGLLRHGAIRGSAAPFGNGKLSGGGSTSILGLESLVAHIPHSMVGDLKRLTFLNTVEWWSNWDDEKARAFVPSSAVRWLTPKFLQVNMGILFLVSSHDDLDGIFLFLLFCFTHPIALHVCQGLWLRTFKMCVNVHVSIAKPWIWLRADKLCKRHCTNCFECGKG